MKEVLREQLPTLIDQDVQERIKGRINKLNVTKLLDGIDEWKRIILGYVIIHFKKIIDNQDVNKMTLQALYTSSGPSIGIDRNIMYILVENCDQSFTTGD